MRGLGKLNKGSNAFKKALKVHDEIPEDSIKEPLMLNSESFSTSKSQSRRVLVSKENSKLSVNNLLNQQKLLNNSSNGEILETHENDSEQASRISKLIDSAMEEDDYKNVALIGSGPLHLKSGTRLNQDSEYNS